MSTSRVAGVILFVAALAALPRISTAQTTLTVNGVSAPNTQTVIANSMLAVQVTQSSGSTTDWITLAQAGSSNTSWIQWRYLNGLTSPPSSPILNATLYFSVPVAIGAYEVRLYTSNSYTVIATSGGIVTQWPSATVGVNSQLPPGVIAAYPGSTVNVNVANGTGVTHDWIGLSEPGTPTESYLAWNYLSGTHTPLATGTTSATVPFTMPAATGLYEFRFFSSTNGFQSSLIGTSTVVVTEQPITVNGELPGEPLLTSPGASLTVAVTNGPANATDWVGLFQVGAPSSSYLEWKYLNGTQTAPATGVPSATLTFTTPSTPGNYEIRSFANNTYTPMGASRVVRPDLGHWRLQGTDCVFDPAGSGPSDECQPSLTNTATYPSASYTLSENRNRLLAAWRNRLHPGMDLCELWASMSDSEQLIFLTLTHRLSSYRIQRPTVNLFPRSTFFQQIPNFPSGDDLLSHIVDLYAIRPKQPDSLGGGEYNRIFVKLDRTAYVALIVASSAFGRETLTGTGPATGDYWLASNDLAGPHSPFDRSAMTHGGESRGQVHFWRPRLNLPASAQACFFAQCATGPVDSWTPWGAGGSAYQPLGRPGVETVADPYVMEMDQDFGFWHDSDVSHRPYAFAVAIHWGDFTPHWRPDGCQACSTEASPQSALTTASAGTVNVAVNTVPTYAPCKWITQRAPDQYFSWITQQTPSTAGVSQIGSGTIQYSVQANTGAQRSMTYRVVPLSRYSWLLWVTPELFDDIPATVTQSAP